MIKKTEKVNDILSWKTHINFFFSNQKAIFYDYFNNFVQQFLLVFSNMQKELISILTHLHL